MGRRSVILVVPNPQHHFFRSGWMVGPRAPPVTLSISSSELVGHANANSTCRATQGPPTARVQSPWHLNGNDIAAGFPARHLPHYRRSQGRASNGGESEGNSHYCWAGCWGIIRSCFLAPTRNPLRCWRSSAHPIPGKGSPAARILSSFGTVTRRSQLTINRVRMH
jgi:hypothetical protein